MNEPRIHFAINCASYSCPNLLNEAYSEKNLNNQLEAAAKSFINDKTKNTITANSIEISSIFDWFTSDFKKKGTLIDFLNKYSSVKINVKAKIRYKEYIEAIRNSSGNSFVHETESQVIINGSYNIGFTMDLALKDLALALLHHAPL